MEEGKRFEGRRGKRGEVKGRGEEEGQKRKSCEVWGGRKGGREGRKGRGREEERQRKGRGRGEEGERKGKW